MWKIIEIPIRYSLLSFGFLAILTAGLYMISFVVPKAAFGARAVASYVCLVLASALGMATGLILSIFGAEGSTQWVAGRAFAVMMWLSTGIKFELVDPKGHLDPARGGPRPAVLVGNHQTELDVLMLGSIFPRHCSITAKASLRRAPVLGWFMSLSRTIFIDRASSADARQAMRGAADEIQRRRQSVYMFPEGTRSYSKEPVLLPFKKGAFHLAVEAGVPIVPCVVANYSHVLWLKGFVFKSGTIPVKVMEPIPTKGLTSADVEKLTRETREKMLKELVTLTAEAQHKQVNLPAELEMMPAVKGGMATTVEAL